MNDGSQVAIVVNLRGAKFELPVDLASLSGNQAYDAITVEEALIMLLPAVTRVVQAVSGDIRQSPTCPPEVQNRGYQVRPSQDGSPAPE